MRRKDREITDEAKIDEIILNCNCCRLGFNDGGKVYIVPLSFGYSKDNGRRTLFFHGAKTGRKIDLINETHYACFEMDTAYRIKPADSACNYTALYQSIIGGGRIEVITDMEEKKNALNVIMLHNSGKNDWDFPDEVLNNTSVMRLEIEEITCKVHE